MSETQVEVKAKRNHPTVLIPGKRKKRAQVTDMGVNRKPKVQDVVENNTGAHLAPPSRPPPPQPESQAQKQVQSQGQIQVSVIEISPSQNQKLKPNQAQKQTQNQAQDQTPSKTQKKEEQKQEAQARLQGEGVKGDKNSNDKKPASDVAEVALNVTDIVLLTLKDASEIPPVPFLSDAAAAALGIVHIVQQGKSNREEFQKLSEDATEVVYAVICTLRDVTQEEVDKDLEEHVKHLVSILTDIERFARKGTGRGMVMGMLRSRADQGKIQEYREKLRQSMGIFGLQSDISIRESVTRMVAKQEEMMRELREDRQDSQYNQAGTDSGSTAGGGPGAMKGPAIRITTVGGFGQT
ncbi:hypothetical protein AMATHDRAFT_63889 [Amanita thiersii Skay4041]|uniref:Uncharacterized protein n=1 Tax=Amanita thiersii Skay4041 TaxID=703135 RepID=A0A2A9NN22_9AGAR|nr:hypothetical protein AMATHDRAFT_63889 [Amanita thiersii Skay4041]